MSKVQKLAIKKKKSRFFEIYIPKILKNISDTNGITNNAKQQFNSVLCFLTKIISSKAYELTILANKKTISEKEVRNTLKFIIILSSYIVTLFSKFLNNPPTLAAKCTT